MARQPGRTTRFLAASLGATALLALAAALVSRTLAPLRQPAPASAPRTRSAPPLTSASLPREASPQLHGRILDADGSAVTGAHVRVIAQERASRVVAETATDRAGGFAFARLGTRRVRVEADHDPQGEVRSAEIVVSEDSSRELTLVLAPAAVRGLVVDADDGHPVAGATLSVEGVPWSSPAVTSDASGSFRFPFVPFEATGLFAVAGGYKAARVALGPREDAPEPDLRVALDRGDPVDGVVLDPDGKPVRARVVACEGRPSEARVESGDDGAFHLPASTDGCDAVALHAETAPSDPARVRASGPLLLRLGAPGGISGSAVDGRGAPLDSFSLGVEAFAGPHGQTVQVRPAAFRGGSFRVDRLVPGSYVLTASTQGAPPARSDPIEVRRGAVTDGVRIVVAAGGVVVGRVVDDRNAPLAGVDLRFDLVSAVVQSDASAKTDDSGRYRLEGAPPGPFTLRAQRDGFRVKLVSGLFVASGQTIAQDVILKAIDGGGQTEFAGIGAALQPVESRIVFGAVFPGDPADRAGVEQGDRLVRIDGEDAALPLVDAIQRLRGQPGTSVGVTVERKGTMLELLLVRASIVH